MSVIRWDPQRDHRDEVIFQVTLCCWCGDTNIYLWTLWTRADHFQLQAVSHSFHIACVDLVIFLRDSDSEPDLPVQGNPQEADA